MDFRTIIAKRRDGLEHTPEELAFLCQGAASGSIPSYQLSAWLMAAYLRPLTTRETADLTLAMVESGERLDLEGVPLPWVDKHSTGGVGDKTSLVLLPLLASCGLSVVKMSGRGLGITGGTIDKLMSVPGLSTDLEPRVMIEQAKEIGIALSGQTPSLAPADKALYAMRDVTETVSSLPLIVSSILSKKIAGGAHTVVLDVKCGSGSFNKTFADAEKLANALKEIGEAAGLRIFPVITDMAQPLGAAVGNALEVKEALDVLSNVAVTANVSRFRELCLKLAGITLFAAEMAPSVEEGVEKARQSLESGAAWEKTRVWFNRQGLTLDLAGYRSWLTKAKFQSEVLSFQSGYIAELDAFKIGSAVVALGGGRAKIGDELKLGVGIELQCAVGTPVRSGQSLAVIHADSRESLEAAREQFGEAVKISGKRTDPLPVILREPEPL